MNLKLHNLTYTTGVDLDLAVEDDVLPLDVEGSRPGQQALVRAAQRQLAERRGDRD